MKITLAHKFRDVSNVNNLLLAWQDFVKGKRKRKDVQEFFLELMDNLFSLQRDLVNDTYKHGQYQAFNICDPKPRNIHKANVRDRLLHRALYRIIYPFFDRIFISDSFSCRLEKGTHKAIRRFRFFAYKASKNETETCWILKCDIRKFFASIDHKTLLEILKKYIPDPKIILLLEKIIKSFYSARIGIGLPLGNLTSQLLVNIYMNEFDQFIKHKLKVKYYIRYADDFVIFSRNRQRLEEKIPQIKFFLENKLKLKLHPNKISIKTLNSGEDFLGWVHFSDHRILRTSTKKRVLKKIKIHPTPESFNSYLGLLKHGNTQKLQGKLRHTKLLT
jgi:retron-type reverse transcriptase